MIMSPQRRSIIEQKYKFNNRAFKSASYYSARWPMTEESYAGPLTKILHSLFFILTFSFPLSVSFGFGPCSHVMEGEKKKKRERDNGTHRDANRSQSGARAGSRLPLSSLAAHRQGGGGVGDREGYTERGLQ